MDLQTTISRIRDDRAALEAQGVKHLSVFGSRVRGLARPDSDLDVLVDIKSESQFSLLDLIAVERIISQGTGLDAQAVANIDLSRDFKKRIAPDLLAVF
jgi:uncharacterized protein